MWLEYGCRMKELMEFFVIKFCLFYVGFDFNILYINKIKVLCCVLGYC